MKQLVPEQDVLYTFVMPKSGDKKRYEFIGETDKGRYMMRNIDEQCNVDFSQKWFAFLASRCLLHKEVSQRKKENDKLKNFKEKLRKAEDEKNKKIEQINKKILEFVKTANKETQKELETLIGKSYKKILSIVCSSEFGLEQASVFNAIENKYFKEKK